MVGIDFLIGYLASGGIEITARLWDSFKKENTFINHDLQKAIRRSYLSALKDIISKCQVDLRKKAYLAWGPLIIYPTKHNEDMRWLHKKLKDLKSVNEEESIDVPFQSLDEIQSLLKPSGSSAQEIIQVVEQRLATETLTDDTIPTCYEEAVRKELFEQMCKYFAQEIKDRPNVRHIFDSQILAQINATLSDQQKKIQNIEELLQSFASFKDFEENSVSESLKLVLIYKRNVQIDEQILNLLETHLTKAGHSIFIDRHIKIGEEWEKQITDEIRNADAVVILLSPLSIYSEMLAYEVDVAYQTAQENKGKPRLFPVRIGFEDPLPQELANKLAPLQYALWRSPDDDMQLVNELLERLANSPETSEKSCSPLEMVGGAVPLDSKFYVVRQVDEDFHAAILRRDPIVLLKGARQVGKTSLLARGMQEAREAGVQVVLTDFQKFIDVQLQSLESFFFAVGEMIADQLDIDVCPQDKWRKNRAPNTNFERYFRREILAKTEKPILWAMDEADRLFHCSFGSEIFAMFRTWHNERALDPGGICSRLTLAIAYATEAYLFIKDQNQSPFNVGTKLVLEDFTSEQVADLNKRHGSPLNKDDLQQFYQLTGGQPYLVRRALNDMVSQNMAFDEFVAKADHEDGTFGDHLRRMLFVLSRDSELTEVVRGVLRGEPCPDYETFYRLRSGGVLTGDSKDSVQPRCEVYDKYLRKHLL